MQFLVRVTIPIDAGNEMIRDPNFAQTIETILGDVKPDNVMFCIESGQRTVYLTMTVNDGSDWVARIEPLWLALSADVEVIPAISQEDFAKAGPALGAIVQKYG
jgi:hypothetical protein